MNNTRSGIVPLVILAIAVVSALVGGAAVAVSKPGSPTSAVGAAVAAGVPAAVAAEPAGPAAMLVAFLMAAIPGGLAYWQKSRAHDATKDELADAHAAHVDTLMGIVQPVLDSIPVMLSKPSAPAAQVLSTEQQADLRKRLADAKAQLATTGQAPVVSIPPPVQPGT